MVPEADAPDSRVIGVAIAIPDPWGSELQKWRESFGDPLAEAIPTHVTLLPPTVVHEGALPDVDRHLRDVAARCRVFSMHLRGTGTFRPVSPVVFVQVAGGIGGCEAAETLVRSGPLSRPIDFPYHPHVTVAHELPDEVLDHAFAELATYEAMFAVSGFGLFEHQDGVWGLTETYGFEGAGS